MDSPQQLALLSDSDHGLGFEARLRSAGLYPLTATGIDILQLNITSRCNLACRHCHVDAKPDRKEWMSPEILEMCVKMAHRHNIGTVDITGGAPELHPQLPWLLRELAGTGKRVIVRTNLLVLLDERFRSYPELYRDCRVEVVASLPDYVADRANRQRGAGNFEGSIRALQALNAIGYGREGTGLVLDIAHNPAGAYLPGNQSSLEREYRQHLLQHHGIEFNRLFVLTNCPIGRFLDFLVRSDNLGDYMQMLRQSFNPSAVPNMMCRTMLSVGWDGRLYDCDFNQVLGLTASDRTVVHADKFDFDKLARREIVVRNHCYACCAGAGSSCQGALRPS
jgi:radical SAM/Cys-rich protein